MTVLFNIDRIFNFFVITFVKEKIRLGTTKCIIRNFALKRFILSIELTELINWGLTYQIMLVLFIKNIEESNFSNYITR